MEVSELIKLDSRKVRSNSNLMAIYINAFEKQFGRKPACAGCTFANDFAKLISAVNKGTQPVLTIQKSRKMENTFKLKRIQNKILAYRKDGKTFRVYDNLMKEDFAVAFLTHGTEEELAERAKLFNTLPSAITGEVKEELSVEETEVPQEEPVKVEEVIADVKETTAPKKTRKPRKTKK